MNNAGIWRFPSLSRKKINENTKRRLGQYRLLLAEDNEASLTVVLGELADLAPDACDTYVNTGYGFSSAMGLLALYSSAVFYASAFAAGKRYAETAPKDLKLPIMLLGAIGSIVTNAFFNWPAYCEILGQHDSLSHWISDASKAFCENPRNHIFAFVASVGTILPFWYVSITNNIGWSVFVSTAAIANIPVFYCGSEVFFEVMAYAEVERFNLRCQWLLECLAGQDVEETNKLIAYTQVKTHLITHFLQLADNFRMASAEQQLKFSDQFLNKNNAEIFEILLHDKTLPHYYNHLRENYFLLFLKFFVLGGFGLLQNFGHVIQAYLSGVEYHWMVGVLFAVCNVLPGIGFTIKGILGFGLLELLFELFLYRSTQQAISDANSFLTKLLVIMVRMSYLFSGMSGDELNYESALAVGASKTVAICLGIASNIGTAVVFNAPQCEIKLSDIQQLESLPQRTLNNFVQTMRTVPLNTVDELVNNQETHGMMLQFFKEKKIDTANIVTSCNRGKCSL